MKILCVFRLFTGIKKYVKYDYPHTGAVAIFEFLNYLKSKKINHKVIFFNINMVEDNFFFFKKKRKKINNYIIYDFFISRNSKFNFFNKILIEFFKYFLIVKEKKKINYDLIYSDYSNIIQMYLLKIINNQKIVIRLLGLYSVKNIYTFNFFKKFFYKVINSAKYNLVICSNDGSCSTKDIKLNFPRTKHVKHIFNGIKKNIPRKKIMKNSIGFIGRLEKIKGIKLFLKLESKISKFVKFYIVGEGKLTRIQKSSFKKIFFLGTIDNYKINKIHQKINLLISINEAGNFSNVNLEAINNHTPFLFCNFSNKNDFLLKKLLKKFDLDLWFKHTYKEIGLLSKIEYFFFNQKKIEKKFKKFSIYFKKNYLVTWEERLNLEFNFIKKIIQ